MMAKKKTAAEPRKLTTLDKARRVCASAGAPITWADRCSEAEQRELADLYDADKATYDDFQAWRMKRAAEKAEEQPREGGDESLEIPQVEREADRT